MVIPKISLNKDVKRKYKHNMSCLSSTTHDFGFLQPVKSYFVQPDSKVSYQVNSAARLAPLPVPTFGKVELKNYSAFVPMSDIFPAWKCLQSNQSFRGINDYIPQSVPYIRNSWLTAMVLFTSTATVWRYSTVSTNYGKRFTSSTEVIFGDDDDQPDIMNLDSFESGNAIKVLRGYYCSLLGVTYTATNPSGEYDEVYCSNSSDHILEVFGNYYGMPQCFADTFNYWHYYDDGGLKYLDCQPVYCGENGNQGNDASSTNYQTNDCWFSGKSTPESADYVAFVRHSGSAYAICFKFSRFTKHLVNILQGLGYQLNDDTSYKSILPLLAYYKAYYDEFAPRRYDNWCDTYCAGLINRLTQFGDSNVFSLNVSLNSGGYQYVWSDSEAQETYETFGKFLLYELSQCYYTEDNTYLNSHIDTLAINNGTKADSNNKFDVVTPSNGTSGSSVINSNIILPPGNQANYDSDVKNGIVISALLKFTRWVNKNSVIGGRIDEYFKTHFGVSAFEDVPHRTRDSVDLNIDDVFSTNESDDVNLGEFAGRGYGRGSSQSYTFEAKEAGYLIIMQCIVPSMTSFYQGEDVTLNALHRFDFPQPEFDALGMESTPVSAICANIPMNFIGWNRTAFDVPNVRDYSAGFGYIPRYSGFKQTKPIVNGDLANRSTRDSLSAYHLQRLIMLDNYNIFKHSGYHFEASYIDPASFAAGTWMRYLTMYPELANFNRIFYNNDNLKKSYGVLAGTMLSFNDVMVQQSMEYLEDNFICHSFVNCTMYTPLKSLSESFDDESENSNNTLSVEHS